MPHPPIINVERPLSVLWLSNLTGQCPPIQGPWLPAPTVAEWISRGCGVALGPTDFATAEAEGHVLWPDADLQQRLALVDDILFDRWAIVASPEDLELATALRPTWDGDVRSLFEVIAVLRQ